MRARDRVRAWVEAFNRADADTLASFYAQDAVNHRVTESPVQGREAIREMFAKGFIMTEWTRRAGAFLLGRKTYEIFAGSWPKSTDPADEIATALNTRPKFVASRTLDEVTWSNSTLLKGDVAEEVARLKAQGSDEIQVHGSGHLLQTLLKHDLIDTQRSTTGAVLHVYERAGDLRYGEVEVGQEIVVFEADAARR